jgi:hypothetical protein
MPPAVDGNSQLNLDALERAVRAAEPCALLVAPWLLQKVVAADWERGLFSMPRAQAHAIGRGRLVEIARREELPLEGQIPPECPVVILLARPEADQLASIPAPELLLRYWRYLFHAKVQGAVRGALEAAESPEARVQERIERVGRAAFNEGRYVLHRERCLAAGADDVEAYAQLVASYLELAYFAPEAIGWSFALLNETAGVGRVFEEDVDAEGFFKSTRPAGAAEPGAGGRNAPAGNEPLPKGRRVRRTLAHRDKLLARAAEADAVGNDVRGALLRMRVYRASGAAGPSRDHLSAVYAEALKDLDQLTARLAAALHLDDSMARQWRAWLVALLDSAARGWWNAEGRLLYDLQKVCVYHEREIYSVNVVDYALDLGRRPLRRPQPGQRRVLMLKSLRSALRRTARARLSPHGRSELQRLLRAAIDDAEERLREFLCPSVTSALDEGGLHPATVTERVAHAKLSEELLDEIVDNGYLSFPAVRDAVSRGQMKLDDLRQQRQTTARKDQLLQVDRKLEENLDYVYRRGEVYLRGFHRFSSLFFGTRVGRRVTKTVILPFGGAFLILEALDHSIGLLIHKIADHQHVVLAAASSATQVFGPTRADAPPSEHQKIFNQWWLLLALGVFLFGLINAAPFRRAVATFFRKFFRGVRVLLVDLPRWVATRPAVQAFFRSRFVRLFLRYVFKPLALAAFACVFLPDTVSDTRKVATLTAVFVAVNVLLNSPAGRAFEQAVLHTLRTTFARFTWDVLAALVRSIVQVFQQILEAVDRLLYAVDELLRFRAGQRRSTVAVKAVLGAFWFFVAYVTRFVINLLVEPQINPIKHFPVVTVSHKLLFPLIFPLRSLFQTVGFGEGQALTYATGIIWCIPGIFGFLAWEFKENWKLYKANRSKNLKPIRVGSHGETLATLLRPGFHSGTIPKIFHKLRKAQARSNAPLPATHKHREALHHVEAALATFLEREFLALLNRHPLFLKTPISPGHIHLATTRILVELRCPALAPTPLLISFEQRAHWIVAAVERVGWTGELLAEPLRQFSAALLGLYKLSGVDFVAEQLQSLFPHGARFDFHKNDLIVWPPRDFSTRAVYDLTQDGPLSPRPSAGGGAVDAPALRREEVFFRLVSVPRRAWVGLWESDADPASLPQVRVLPARPQAATPPAVVELAPSRV